MSYLCLACLLAEGLSLFYVFTLMQRRVMTLSSFSFVFFPSLLRLCLCITSHISCISIILSIRHAESTTVFPLPYFWALGWLIH
ncbi:hypothetical protein BDV34DRAFT_52229 [Aspergillus parasiticus]|uniref:Uncharacterized protein n=1 Tax=Aspergillus parasiticus TaxID=5067 RepID=A0A5N6D408_ASPPA|nr:hypothetical protein BDV34DRAFT_52229 [Aspergillus parasiticus]